LSKNQTHSEHAKRNMTKQLTAQLTFYLNNLEKKENLYERSRKMLARFPRLGRGIKWTMRRQLRGIDKVQLDITNMRSRIAMRLENGEIFPISLE